MLLHLSNIDLANMCVLSLKLCGFEVLGTVVLVIKKLAVGTTSLNAKAHYIGQILYRTDLWALG